MSHRVGIYLGRRTTRPSSSVQNIKKSSRAAKAHVRILARALTAIKHLLPTEKDKVSKGAKIRSRYNQVPHLTQDTNGKVTNSQLDTTNESQEVSLYCGQKGTNTKPTNGR